MCACECAQVSVDSCTSIRNKYVRRVMPLASHFEYTPQRSRPIVLTLGKRQRKRQTEGRTDGHRRVACTLSARHRMTITENCRRVATGRGNFIGVSDECNGAIYKGEFVCGVDEALHQITLDTCYECYCQWQVHCQMSTLQAISSERFTDDNCRQ